MRSSASAAISRPAWVRSSTRIQDLQINHFYKCDPKYGEGVAKAIGRKIEDIVKKEELVTA